MYKIIEKENGNVVISSTKENKVIEIRKDGTLVFSDTKSEKEKNK